MSDFASLPGVKAVEYQGCMAGCVQAHGKRLYVAPGGYQWMYGGMDVFFASGRRLVIWDERPNRPAYTCSGRVEKEQPLEGFTASVGIAFCRQIFAFIETIEGGFSEMSEADFEAAVLRLTLSVSSNRPELAYQVDLPPRRRRRQTQKRLDGGEDMTV